MVRKTTEGNDFGQITAIIRRQGMKRVSFSFLSKTVLDSESQAMDSRFQVLDSGFFFSVELRFWIPSLAAGADLGGGCRGCAPPLR